MRLRAQLLEGAQRSVILLLRCQHRRQEGALLAHDRIGGARRSEKSHDVEPRMLAREHVQIEVLAILGEMDPARFEAWNAWPIAGGPQDDVGLDLAPVHEPYRAPSKLRDVRFGDDVAVREIVQQLRVDDRMSRERLVVRLRKTVTA